MPINNDGIISNGEEFTRSDYNGVNIIIRNKDGYINATKIARDNGKQNNLARYLNSDKWLEICEAYKNSLPQKRGNKIEPCPDIQLMYTHYVNTDMKHYIKFIIFAYI